MKILLVILIYSSSLFAINGRDIAVELNLIPGYKAIIQWEKVFKNERKMKKYKIINLSKNEKILLKNYLIEHAVDSDEPEIAGNEGI